MAAVRGSHQSVLTTIRGSDGLPQLSNVGHMVGADGVIRVSTTADRAGDLFSWEQEPDRSQFNPEEILKIL